MDINELDERLELLSIELDVLAEIIKGIEQQANELEERLRDV
jgi:chaperonin cofactor prefoldin